MVDLKYVRQRKVRKIIAASGSICASLATVIAIVAILAQHPGAFVVSLENDKSKLSLADSLNSDSQLTYINAGEVPQFVEYENNALLSNYESENLDSEHFDYRANASTGSGSIKFFQTTFYVKNVGEVTSGYSLSLKFISVTKSVSSGYELDSVLRVRFYENKVNDDGTTTHNFETYAKRSGINWHYDENGNQSYDELISDEGSGYAKPFQSSSTILSSKVTNFNPGDMYRYTFVFWIEGNDPECVGEPPLNSKLDMGVSIAAHEEAKKE